MSVAVLSVLEVKKKKEKKEAIPVSSNGALQRPKVKKVAESNHIFTISSLREAIADDDKREFEVIMLKEGKGNQRDKHFYTADAINKAPQAFEGAQCYADHPTKIEETSRPERSIRDIVGHYERVRSEQRDGVACLIGTLKINQGCDWAWNLAKEAIAYSLKYPDKDLVGISINADGKTYQDDLNGEQWNYVTEINNVFSADIVTRPGAGGKFLELDYEKEKGVREMSEACKSCEALKKGIAGLVAQAEAQPEQQDYKKGMAELASKMKAMLAPEEGAEEEESEGEAENETEAEKKEDEAENETESKVAKESDKPLKRMTLLESEVAMLKTKLAMRDKNDLIDGMLKESKLPNIATKGLRPILAKCSTKEEMSMLVKNWKESLKESISESKPEGGSPKVDYEKVDDVYSRILNEAKKK